MLIECKAHTAPVGVAVARALLGSVSHEQANRGVLITISRFTRGCRELAASDARLEPIDGEAFTKLLCAQFGASWHQNRDSMLLRFN